MKDNKKKQGKSWIEKTIEKINNRKILILSIIFVVCFILGIIGFYKEWNLPPEKQNEPIDFLNAMYLTLTLFALNYSDKVSNGILNIARFGASIFTVGGLLIVFGQGVKFIWNYINGKVRSDSVYVFGETDEAKELVESIGWAAVTSPKTLLKAKSYVLMASEEENLKFYYDHKKEMGEKPVFIRTNVFGQIMVTGDENDSIKYNHTFFSIDEIVAKKYWMDNVLIDLAKEKQYRLDVAIVGFNALGEALLFQALQMNILDTNQQITYHLWGESKFSNQAVDVEDEYLACFEATHINLDKLNVIVHHEPWYKACDELNRMDRIIVSDYLNAIPLVQRLLQRVFTNHIQLDVFYKGNIDAKLMMDHRYGKISEEDVQIQLFDYLTMGCDWSAIKTDDILNLAKKLNWEWKYIYDYEFEAKDKDKLEDKLAILQKMIDSLRDKEKNGDIDLCWRSKNMGAEKRYSNYSSALYQPIREQLVKSWEAKEDIVNNGNEVNWRKYISELNELEHMRWCNCYWFLNWNYADIELINPRYVHDENVNPIIESRKLGGKRLHNDLQPFENLAQYVKNLDELQVRIGFGEDYFEDKKREIEKQIKEQNKMK